MHRLEKKLEWTEHKAPPVPILAGSEMLPDSLYLYGVDFDELIEEDKEFKLVNYLKYIEELKKGKILRIRVDDKSNGCKKDLAFDLEGFDKAVKQLSNEMADFINLAILEDELNKK